MYEGKQFNLIRRIAYKFVNRAMQIPVPTLGIGEVEYKAPIDASIYKNAHMPASYVKNPEKKTQESMAYDGMSMKLPTDENSLMGDY